MCTVTVIPKRRGYWLAMNRDEKLQRAEGLAPRVRTVGGRKVVYPAEPGGGTWISLNEAGVTFALINWYSVAIRPPARPVSRGHVVRTLAPVDDPAAASARLMAMPLARTRPFRLIAVFPSQQAIAEWQWDGSRLRRQLHDWQSCQFISSGYDERGAQRSRGAAFRRALHQKPARSLGWLRRLHQSHAPVAGACSTCMHRADAATVSYTEITAKPGLLRMAYAAGPPCRLRNEQASVLCAA